MAASAVKTMAGRHNEHIMPIDPDVWNEVRHAFEHSDETVAIIARRYGVTANQIRHRRQIQNWAKRPAGAEALAIANAKRQAGITRPSYAEPLAPPERKATRGGGTLPHRKAIIKRLYDILDAKIAEIEQRVASDRKLELADAERETRDIGNQIKHFEKLTEISDAAAKAAKSTDAGTHSDDTERFREELIQRLERIRVTRERDRAAGADETA